MSTPVSAETPQSRTKSIVITYFPMLIAVLSLTTSIYNGYLNNRFVDIIQRNVGRSEYMRTCKDIIDAYFQVKFRTRLVSETAGRESAGAAALAAAQVDAANAATRFAALGTYLANLRDDGIRQRYTELSQMLETIVASAGQARPGEIAQRFAAADALFAAMNNDCVASAKAAPM